MILGETENGLNFGLALPQRESSSPGERSPFNGMIRLHQCPRSTFLRSNFFLARLDFFPPPLTAPGSPSMRAMGNTMEQKRLSCRLSLKINLVCRVLSLLSRSRERTLGTRLRLNFELLSVIQKVSALTSRSVPF